MNIAFVSYTYWPPDFGGELLLAIERLQSLASRGHHIAVLTSGRPGFPSHVHLDGMTILRSPMVHTSRPGRLLRRAVHFAWALTHLLSHRYDAVHFGSMPGVGLATDALTAFILAGIARWRGARTVTVHALADSESAALELSGRRGSWKRLYYHNMDHIVAVSPALYAPLQAHFPRKAILILYAVRDDIFVPLDDATRRRVRGELGAGDEHVVFTFLGTVCYRKGFDLLARAFAELAPGHPNWRLWVIGPRSYTESQNLRDEEAQEVMAPLRGLDSQITYFGRVDDRGRLAELLGAGDVFVFPSRREGFGLAPVEAMAAGVSPIIARIPGVTDLASVEGETGLYIPPNDPEALKQAMERLGNDPGLRRQMGQKAVQRVKEAFSWEPYIDRWEQLYRDGHVF
ncbi:MAG: glycosyltransferase family 4 protein [Anaerolineae bacterium]|nr:glycosyltransferase family 4 protein [Anaerolineae bacterium]